MKKSIFCAAILALCIPLATAFGADQVIAKLKLTKKDLPAGYDIGKKIDTSRIQPVSFYENPSMSGSYPMPLKKEFQNILFKKKSRGTLFWYQYKNDQDARESAAFLKSLFWEEDKEPTDERPEEVYSFDNIIIVLCFEYLSDESYHIRSVIKEKTGTDLFTPEERFQQIMKGLAAYKNDPDAGLAYLQKNWELVKDYSFTWSMMGDLYAKKKKDWAASIKHYRKALDMHKSGNELPNESALRVTCFGLGNSYVMADRHKDAIEAYKIALEVAKKNEQKDNTGITAYRIARSYVALKKFKDTESYLKEAIDANPKYKSEALEDPGFKDALKDKKIKELLKD